MDNTTSGNGGNGADAAANPQPRRRLDPVVLERALARINEQVRVAGGMVVNALTSRLDWLRNRIDRRRDIDEECGYPIGEIQLDSYQQMYDREPIAARVVQVLPKECWKIQPRVYELEEAAATTPFEEALNGLSQSLHGTSRYADQQGNPLWEYLKRVDVLSGIGRFGVLFIAIDDGKPLNEPAFTPVQQTTAPAADTEFPYQTYPGVLPWDASNPSGKPVTVNLAPPRPPKPAASATDPGKGVAVADDTSYTPPPTPNGAPKAPARKLLYLRAFPETMVQIERYDTNPASPRFGMPELYLVTFSDPRQTETGAGAASQTNVHWTRILHVAETEVNEVFGVSRMQRVMNPLLDIRKVRGASAEMFWQGAMPELFLETPPELGSDVDVDDDALREAMERARNGLQRFVRLTNLQAKQLAPTVVDPTSQIEVQIDAICIYLGVPKRIFMGSERGELASSEDKDSWSERVQERRDNYLTPRIIIPVIDRFIKMGVLPEVEKFHVWWPGERILGKMEQADRAQKLSAALAQYASSGAADLLPFVDFLTVVWGMEEAEAEDLAKRAEEFRAQREQQAHDQQMEQMKQAAKLAPPPPPGAGGNGKPNIGGAKTRPGRKPTAGPPGRGNVTPPGPTNRPRKPAPTANVDGGDGDGTDEPPQPRGDDGSWYFKEVPSVDSLLYRDGMWCDSSGQAAHGSYFDGVRGLTHRYRAGRWRGARQTHRPAYHGQPGRPMDDSTVDEPAGGTGS